MIRTGEVVFVDTGAWIALAVTGDPLHDRARDTWETMDRAGAKVLTSIPVVLETFTYLDRKGSRELALRWRAALSEIRRFEIAPCSRADIDAAWDWVERPEFKKLGLVDATSFVIMRKLKIRRAFAFDVHFAQAGFRYAG